MMGKRIVSEQQFYEELSNVNCVDCNSDLSNYIEVYKDGKRLHFVKKIFRGRHIWNAEVLNQQENGDLIVTKDGEYSGVLSKIVKDVEIKYKRTM